MWTTIALAGCMLYLSLWMVLDIKSSIKIQRKNAANEKAQGGGDGMYASPRDVEIGVVSKGARSPGVPAVLSARKVPSSARAPRNPSNRR